MLIHNTCYRDVQQLAGSLAVLLSDPSRVCLLHEVCQLLPANDQVTFDRIAASVIGEGKLIILHIHSFTINLVRQYDL